MKTKVWCLTLGQVEEAFIAFCQNQGIGIQEAIRQIIAGFLKNTNNLMVRSKPKSSTRLDVRFSSQEMADLQSIADSQGMKPQDWVRACLHYAKTGQCELGTQEIEALMKFLEQYRGVCSNLNQIARHLNAKAKSGKAEAALSANEVNLHREIKSLESSYGQALQKVTQVIQANNNRWKRNTRRG